MGKRGSLCLLKHLTSSWARYQIHILIIYINLFCSILLKFLHDEAGLLRNRFYFCWSVVAITRKWYMYIALKNIFKEIFFQRVGSSWFCNPRLTPSEKINDLWNEYRNIQLVNYICSVKNFQWKKKGFLMVNVHNSKNHSLPNKDSALQRNVQHKLVWRWCNSFRPCCGVDKLVRNFDATYHDVTP